LEKDYSKESPIKISVKSATKYEEDPYAALMNSAN
jgi:hypothetical protein